jgi:nucleoside phosphorylase
MRAMLDSVRVANEKDDPNDYVAGAIPADDQSGSHNVVVTLLKKAGNNSAAAAAAHLLRSFPSITDVLMVGIAGGIPNPGKADKHVRLGDLVISNEYGVVQYDNGALVEGRLKLRDTSQPPSAALVGRVKLLESERLAGRSPWEAHIARAQEQLESAARPDPKSDRLFAADDPSKRLKHPRDPLRRPGRPKLHYGRIGSANTLLKDPKAREALRMDLDLRAVEMEGSGIADGTWLSGCSYLLVRGVSDYCDLHKNTPWQGHADAWQGYAAVVAAAYARSLIGSFPAPGGLIADAPLGLIGAYKESLSRELKSFRASYIPQNTDVSSLLELRAREDIETEPSEQTQQQDQNPLSLSTWEWLSRNDKIILTGSGGAGKTATLHWLCYRLCQESPIEEGRLNVLPILVRLTGFSGDIEAIILSSIQRLNSKINRQTLLAIVSEAVPILLLDEFDECTQQRQVLKALRAWTAANPQAKAILASRPQQNLLGDALKEWIRLTIQPLTDDELLVLFGRVLDVENANALLSLLEERGLLDAFRLPLLALFAAEAARGPDFETAISSTGQLYNRVITQLLQSPDAQRGNDLSDARISAQKNVLGLLASMMARQNSFSLPLNRITRIWSDELDMLAGLGVLSIKMSSVSFSHASLRDFFLAHYWSVTGNSPSLIRIALGRLTYDPYIFWISLVDDETGDKYLSWLVTIVSMIRPLIFLEILPSSVIFYLTLLLLSESGPRRHALKDKFLKAAEGFHGGSSALPQRFSPMGWNEDTSANYFYHLGKLGTHSAFRLLTKANKAGWTNRRYKIFGLLHFQSQETLNALLDGLDKADGIADGHSVRIIVHFSPALVQRAIREHLDHQRYSVVRRFLERLSSELAGERQTLPREPAPSRPSYRNVMRRRVVEERWWVDFLVELFTHVDKAISDGALSVMRGLQGFFLRSDVEKRLIEVASHADPEIKCRAVWAFVYSRTEESLACIESALNDEHPLVVFTAMDALRLRDRKKFREGLLSCLKRFLWLCNERMEANAADLQFLSEIRKDSAWSEDDEKQLLVISALFHEFEFLRSWSASEIGLRDSVLGERICRRLLDKDNSTMVKVDALCSLISMLPNEVVNLIELALTNPNSEVRTTAIRHFVSVDQERVHSFATKLKELAYSDESSSVRSAARTALISGKLLEVGSEEWKKMSQQDRSLKAA